MCNGGKLRCPLNWMSSQMSKVSRSILKEEVENRSIFEVISKVIKDYLIEPEILPQDFLRSRYDG